MSRGHTTIIDLNFWCGDLNSKRLSIRESNLLNFYIFMSAPMTFINLQFATFMVIPNQNKINSSLTAAE
jgi:hypothetical protein